MARKASKRDAQPRRRHGLGALGYAWLILITAVVGLAGWAQFFRDETEPTQFVAQIDLPPVASLPVPMPPPAVEAPVPPPVAEAPAPVPEPPPPAVAEKPVEPPPPPAPEPKPAEVKPAEPPPVVETPKPEEPKAPAIAAVPAPLPPPALVPERPIMTPGPPGPAPAPQAAPEPTPPPAPQAAKPAVPPKPAPPNQAGQPQAPGQQAAATRPPAPARDAGQPPWIRYAFPFDANDRRPRIAIVISELGLSSAATDVAIQQMPGPVTLAFSPYAEESGAVDQPGAGRGARGADQPADGTAQLPGQ